MVGFVRRASCVAKALVLSNGVLSAIYCKLNSLKEDLVENQV